MKQRFMESSDAPAPGTQAVARALAILQAFDAARPEWRLNDLAAELGLHKTSVFRLLGALEREGFVARDAERQSYRLGPSLIALGTQALRSTDLHAVAHPVLRSLASETGEAATLEVLVGDEVLILDEVQGRFLLGSRPEIGTRWPAHAASTGKVLLAAARFEGGGDPEGRTPPRGRLARLAPNTITTRARLDRELAQVWRLGFAVGTEEIERGFTAVGAPVRNFERRVIAAISVGGPMARISARIPQLAERVREAADRISERLGATGCAASPRAPADREERARRLGVSASNGHGRLARS